MRSGEYECDRSQLLINERFSVINPILWKKMQLNFINLQSRASNYSYGTVAEILGFADAIADAVGISRRVVVHRF